MESLALHPGLFRECQRCNMTTTGDDISDVRGWKEGRRCLKFEREKPDDNGIREEVVTFVLETRGRATIILDRYRP